MAQNNGQILNAQQIILLRQSLTIMTFAENVDSLPTAPPPPGWTVLASTDPPKSENTYGLFAKIFKRKGAAPPGQPEYVAAFRGTDKFSDLGDMRSDLAIADRRLPDQYGQGLAFVQKVCIQNRIDPTDMMFTGHSLGGYLAHTIGETLGAKSIWTFNAPGPSEQMQDQLIRRLPGVSADPGSGLVQIRSVDDLISDWGYKEGITIGVKTAGEPHGLASLRQAVTETVNGQPEVPVNPPRKGSLAAIFDAVTERIAQSKFLNRFVINRAMDNASPPVATAQAKQASRPKIPTPE